MAKILEQTLTIKLSKLVKDDDYSKVSTEDLVASLESIVQELVGSNIVIEIETE